jgi:hypothetical protein
MDLQKLSNYISTAFGLTSLEPKNVGNETDVKTYSFVRNVFEGSILIVTRIISFNLLYAYSEWFRSEWKTIFEDKELRILESRQEIPHPNPNLSTKKLEVPKDLAPSKISSNQTEHQIETVVTTEPQVEKAKEFVWPSPDELTEWDLQLLEGKPPQEFDNILAKVPLEIVKKLLRENCFNNILLSNSLLPLMVSEKHLTELSIDDFIDETQMAKIIWGKQTNLLNLYEFLKKDSFEERFNEVNTNLFAGPNATNAVSEIRKRFTLLASGKEVKIAIDAKKLCQDWMVYLSPDQLKDLTLVDLQKQNRLERVFPLKSLFGTMSLDKDRFAVFKPEDIQNMIKGIPDQELNDYILKPTNSAFWSYLPQFLSTTQLQGIKFGKEENSTKYRMRLGQIALLFDTMVRDQYKNLTKQQKIDIFTQFNEYSKLETQAVPDRLNPLMFIWDMAYHELKLLK